MDGGTGGIMLYTEYNNFVSKDPYLKSRSFRSKEKLADSMMNISNIIILIVFVSVVLIPLVGILRVLVLGYVDLFAIIYDSEGASAFLLMFFVVNVFGVFYAYRARQRALDIYDSFES